MMWVARSISSGSAAAEEKIRAVHHRSCVQPLSHDRVEEFARRKGQQRFVGRVRDHRVHPQFREQFRLAIRPRQRRRRGVRPQQPHGMRVERKHHRWPVDGPRLFQQPRDDPCVAAMHAVEIADRHRAGKQFARPVVRSADQFHGESVCE